MWDKGSVTDGLIYVVKETRISRKDGDWEYY